MQYKKSLIFLTLINAFFLIQAQDYLHEFNADTSVIKFQHDPDFVRVMNSKEVNVTPRVFGNKVWVHASSPYVDLSASRNYYYTSQDKKIISPFINNLPPDIERIFYTRINDFQLIVYPEYKRKIWLSSPKCIITDMEDNFLSSFEDVLLSYDFSVTCSEAFYTSNMIQIDSFLYFRMNMNQEYISGDPEMPKIRLPQDLAFGKLNIYDLLNSGKIDRSQVSYIHLPKCGVYRNGMSTNQRSFCYDTLTQNLFYLDGLGDKLIAHNVKTGQSKCYPLPELPYKGFEVQRYVDLNAQNTEYLFELRNDINSTSRSAIVYDEGLFASDKANEVIFASAILLEKSDRQVKDKELFSRLRNLSNISFLLPDSNTEHIFNVYQWIKLEDGKAIITREVIVPYNHGIRVTQAEAHSLSGFKAIKQDDITLPIEITWDFK